MKTKISIDGNDLKLSDVRKVAFHECRVTISEGARHKIKKSRTYIDKILQSRTPVYGLNTGFGSFSDKKIKHKDLQKLQENLIRSHCAGIGNILDYPTVRSLILLRANVLCKGLSGVRPTIPETLCLFLNQKLYPVVYEQGSVGASGDLAPLAQLALCLIGEGYFIENNKIQRASRILKKNKIKPISLAAKEGLSLINGTQLMTAIGCTNIFKARNILKIADIAAAATLESVQGSHKPFDPDIINCRPYKGAKDCASNLRILLKNSVLNKSHKNCSRVQDAYSLRCVPQVHGAVRDVYSFSKSLIEIELNSAVDNPLVFADKAKIVSCGNFHGQPIAYAMDCLSIALTGISNISERRLDKILNPTYSKLPAFLAKNSGLESGLMAVQYASASLASENKTLAAPASIDSIPTSMDKEDHVSMGPIAARKVRSILDNLENVLAMEILAAFFALEFYADLKPGRGISALCHFLKKFIPRLSERTYNRDIALVRERISDGSLLAAVEKECGLLK